MKDFAKNKRKTIRKQDGLDTFATRSPGGTLKNDISAAPIEQTATIILLPNPNTDKKDYTDGLEPTEAEFNVIVNLDERSRCFLIRQNRSSVVCQLNLRGIDDVLLVVSASTDNIEVMYRIIGETAQVESVKADSLHPEQWSERFYRERKGSRNSGVAVKP